MYDRVVTIMFDDLPNHTEPATGHANQPTTEQST